MAESNPRKATPGATTRLETSPAAGDRDSAQTAELDRLREENDRLRDELEAARDGRTTRPKPHKPSFGMSEGERADLEQRGVTTSPWTGEQLTADGEGVEPANDEARRASARAERGTDRDAGRDADKR